MTVSTAGHDAQSTFLQHLGHHARIVHNLPLIHLEFLAGSLLECHCLGGNNMHQRAALNTGKNRRVQHFFKFCSGQDDPAARTAQRLVSGTGNKIGNTDWTRIYPCCDQASVMRHVNKQVSADAVCNGAETLPIDHQRIGGRACHDHLRLVCCRERLHLIVVDLLFFIQPVLDRVVQLAADVHRCTVGQMAAVRQRHAKDSVAGLEHRRIHRLIGLRTGMWLHVGVLCAEQRLYAVDRKLLGHVHIFATAVIALTRISFGVFVGQLAALRFHHCRAGVIFRGDQLDVVFLTAVFILDRCPQFRIGLGDGVFAGEHGGGS